MRMDGRNCILVQKTGIKPFRRCLYCDRSILHCFGLQFFLIVLFITMLIGVMFTVRDLPALAFDIAFLILVMVVLLEFIANGETNEIVIGNSLLREINDELEKRAMQRTKELRLLNLELQKALRTKSEFLRNINHDLRTPLTTITGYVDILESGEKGGLSEQQIKHLNSIKKNSQDLLVFINQILELSKLETNRIEENKKEFDIKKLIEGSIVGVEYLATKKEIKVETSFECSPCYAYADPEHVKQIMMNLLINAIKFSGKGGSVNVDVRENLGHVYVSVRDTGIGISKEDQSRIFEAYTQVGSGLPKEEAGMGIGLSIVKSFVDASGGTIAVDSEPGKGSTFTFTLPKKRT